MNKQVKEKWINALRSGEYKQCKGQLRDDDNHYCCLGVLSELAVKDKIIPRACNLDLVYSVLDGYSYDGEEGTLPIHVQEWAGVDANGSYKSNTLIEDNDEGKTFEEIADIIEKEF